MAESERDLGDDALSRCAAESFAAAHPDTPPPTVDASPRHRALAERLAAGPRPRPSSTETPARTTRTIGGPALALALAIAAVALLVLAWPRRPSDPPTTRAPAEYQLELGGAATELGDGAPRVDRAHVRRGARVVIRATPARPSPTPRVRARWAGEAHELAVDVEHQAGGTMILRMTMDRDPGRHTLELSIGDDDCAWDRRAIGCEQPSIDVEIDP